MKFSTVLSKDHQQMNIALENVNNPCCDSALPALFPVNLNQPICIHGGIEGHWLHLSNMGTNWLDSGNQVMDDQALQPTDCMSALPSLGQYEESQVIGQERWIYKHKIRGTARFLKRKPSTNVT